MGMLIGVRVLNQGGAYWKEGAYHKGGTQLMRGTQGWGGMD